MLNRREVLQGALTSVAAAAGLKPEQIKAVESDKPPIAFVIEVPGRVSYEAHRNLCEAWDRAFKGTEYAKTPAIIMEEGMRLHVITDDSAVSAEQFKAKIEATSCE